MTKYPEIKLTIKLDNLSDNNEINRNNLRKLAVKKFTEESAGTGRAELSTNYKYVVEILQSGDKIYITRPAFNKLGFDFLIHIENNIFSNNRDNPKHDDFIDDLKAKISIDNSIKTKILDDLNKVFNCYEPDDVVNYKIYNKLSGYPMDLILKTSKWFFIEQDIRYWNYSGRNMLMNGYKKILTS